MVWSAELKLLIAIPNQEDISSLVRDVKIGLESSSYLYDGGFSVWSCMERKIVDFLYFVVQV